jgi:methyltransferase (TIGR00027 family)
MSRSDDDSWDIASSVGATAVMVALARASETNSDDPLIRDEFAETLVSTPELAELRAQVASWWTIDEAEATDGRAVSARQMVTYQAVRTHFFDAFFAEAAGAGIRQYVILAAGLDSRAYRLGWPDNTVVYEIDLPLVLEYKARTLAEHGAKPTTTRREVATDLRHDWPAALRDAGFDPAATTMWLAEGLLPFLPGPAQEAMFAAIDRLSASGSRIAIEVFGIAGDDWQEARQRWAETKAERESRGETVAFDPFTLWYDNEGRPDSAEWLHAHGWAVQSMDGRDESVRLGRPPVIPPPDAPRFVNTFITALKR